jgi:hypothetical protein
MLQDSTKGVLVKIVQVLETAVEVDWDDQGLSGRECLYEMHQMTRPASQAYRKESTDAKWPSRQPDFTKLNRALPHVKAMVNAIRHQDRSAALFSGKAALAEM